MSLARIDPGDVANPREPFYWPCPECKQSAVWRWQRPAFDEHPTVYDIECATCDRAKLADMRARIRALAADLDVWPNDRSTHRDIAAKIRQLLDTEATA